MEARIITFLSCPGSSAKVPAPADAARAMPIDDPAKPPARAIAPPMAAKDPGSNNIANTSLLRFYYYGYRYPFLKPEWAVFPAPTLVEFKQELDET
jgi:hypothetical protein